MTTTSKNDSDPSIAVQNEYIAVGEVQSTSIPWYSDSIAQPLPAHVQNFFQSYVGLASEEVVPHIKSVRDEAWRIKPYPCIGQYTFIHTPMYGQSVYWDILSRLKEGSIFLDVGTCFGQELRRLLADGAPNQNMFAVDLSSEFWELGYRLFKDRGRIHAKLIIADILAKGNGGTELETLVGKIDIIHAGSFFHLFDWNDQVAALKKLVMLSRVGALLVGHHIGRKPAKCTLIRGEPRYYHDEESWRKIWKETEEATGTEWMIDVEVGKHDILGLKQEDFAWMGPFARALRFVAIRRT